MAKKEALLIAILLLLSLTLAAFHSPSFQAQTGPARPALLTVIFTPSPPPSQTPNPTISPLAGAQQWLEVLNSKDESQILAHVCQSQQADVKARSGWVAAFPALHPLPENLLSQIEGIYQALRFDLIRQEEARARIRVHGNLPVTGGLMAVYGVDERWLMVYEEGVWRWCGTNSGDATPTLTPTITTTPWPISRADRTGGNASPIWWRALLAIAAVLGAIGRIYSMIQRSNRNRTENH